MSLPKLARREWWFLALAIGFPVLAIVLAGPDANWDLRNYHLYNPHAWVTGRLLTDIAPAQLQTWHNPLLDMPLYWLVRSGAPLAWMSAWLTLPYIACMFWLLHLQRLMSNAPPSRISQFFLVLLAISGAATFSTLGTSFNDGFVAAAVLGALALVLDPRADGRRWLIAGILLGGIAGLKLVAVVYCLGLAGAAFFAGPMRRAPGRITWLAAGGLLGFLATYGYWGWRMFELHGNPVFPYFNDFFQSPNALPEAYVDARFRPDSWLDALLAPVYLVARSTRFSEIKLSDPRLLFGAIAFVVLLVGHAATSQRSAVAIRQGVAALSVFFVVAMLAWSFQYGIYRYAVALEMLACLAIVLLVCKLPVRAQLVMLLVVTVIVSAATKRPNWRNQQAMVVGAAVASTVAIPGDSLVLIAGGEPLGYVALGLPRSVPMVSVNNNFMQPGRCTALQSRIERVIAGHAGPVWLLSESETSMAQAQATVTKAYGLAGNGECLLLNSALGSSHLCPQSPAPSRFPCGAGR